MGIAQKVRNGELMGAPRQAVAALAAGVAIDLLPPVPSTPDQVVSLLAESDQVVANGKIAEAQKIRDRQLLRTREALPAFGDTGRRPVAQRDAASAG